MGVRWVSETPKKAEKQAEIDITDYGRSVVPVCSEKLPDTLDNCCFVYYNIIR